MSSRSPPHSPKPASKEPKKELKEELREFTESLEQPAKLAELVRKLMELHGEPAHRLIGDTTKTGFRRVHEHIALVIDKALETLAHSKLDNESLNKITMLFIRGLVLVNYQEARRQLSRGLANTVKAMINHVLDTLKTKDEVKIKGALESMRTLMDTLLILVHRFSR